jgi:hypothetical protein
MSTTVERIMEKAGLSQPMAAIDLIRDAFMQMGLTTKEPRKVAYANIVSDNFHYALPSDMNSLISVSVRNEDQTNERLATLSRTFTGGSTLWANGDMASFDETTDLSVTNNASGQYCKLVQADVVVTGKRYRFYYDANITSGTFELQSYTGRVRYGALVTGTQNYIEFTATEDDNLAIVATSATGAADFDNLSLKERGNVEYRRASAIVGSLNEVWTDNMTGAKTAQVAATITAVSDTFTLADTAPSVLGKTSFITNSNVGITTFDNGVEGQTIRVFVADAVTTLLNGATLALPGGVDLAFSAGDVFEAIYRSGVWYVWIPRIG